MTECFICHFCRRSL